MVDDGNDYINYENEETPWHNNKIDIEPKQCHTEK